MNDNPILKTKQSIYIKILKIFGVLFLLTILSGIIIGLVFGNDIKQLVVTEINKQLAVEVKVNGEIDFSVLRNFPYASVTFNEIEIKESFKGSKSNLLESKTISLLFNLIDIWKGNYSIKKIIIGKGKLNVVINEKGEGNYFILKSGTDTASDSVTVNIDKIQFSDLETKFIDDENQQLYEFQIHDGILNGEFSTDILKLKLKTNLLCKHLFVSSDDYLQNKELSVSTDLNLNLKKEEYDFLNTDIEIENFAFSTSGKVKQKKNSTFLDIIFTGKQIGIESFAGILPDQYSVYLKKYNTIGNLILNGKIIGDYSSKRKPDISIAFTVKDATISNTEISKKFEHVNFNAQFSNGTSRNLFSSQLILKNASALINGKTVNFSLEIRNFIKPYLDLQLNTVLDLSEIYPLFKIPELKDASGELQLNKCFYSGPVSQLTLSPDFKSISSGGEIILLNGKMNYNGTSFESINANLKLQNGNLLIEKIESKTTSSDFIIHGNCLNLLPFIFNNSEKGKTSLKVGTNLTIASTKIDANEFSENHTSEQTGIAGSTAIASLLEIFTGNINFTIDHFKYDRFNATNFKGTLVCTGDKIFFNNISMNAEKGKAIINAQLNFQDWNSATLDGTFIGNNIDINQMFYEFNNWGQTEITDKNLKGNLTANLVLKAGWNKNEFDYNKLVVVADVTIDKGELNNFEPMKSLSSFIKISELENIRFTQLKNQIEIRNSTINIPTMNIYTNALNLELTGSHTFKNIIDYRIKLNLLQLLSNKFKTKNNFDPDAIEQNSEGLMFLYITMKGPASDPIIKYDKKSVKEKIRTDMQLEKQNLKTILQQEFSNQQNQQQEITDWKAPEEFEIMKFEDTTSIEEINFNVSDNSESENSITKQKQKEAFNQFKKSLQKKQGTPK